MTLPPAKLVYEAALQIGLPATGVALLLTAIVAAIFGRRAIPWVAPLAVAGGWAAGNHFRDVVPWLPDGRRVQWIPILLGLAAACGWLTRLPRAVFGAAFVAVLAVAISRLVPPAEQTKTWWLVPLAVAVPFAVGTGLADLSRRQPGFVVPGVLMVSLASVGTVAIHASSGQQMDIASLAAAAVGGVLAVVTISKADAGTIAPFAAVAASAVALLGYLDTTSDVPAIAFLLPALSPLGVLVADLPGLNRIGGWKRTTLQCLFEIVPSAVGVALAAANAPIDFDSLGAI